MTVVAHTSRNAPATEKQITFIESLIARDFARDPDNLPEALCAFRESLEDPANPFTRPEASEMIDRMLKSDREAREEQARDLAATRPADTDVRAGRYALSKDGQVHMFQVDRPTRGRWDGWTFVNEIRPNGDRIRPIKGRDRAQILAAIAADPIGASAGYGKRAHSCGVCGLTLTKEESIERGIGPVCVTRF